jgi:uncharacterized membrane protein YidH (DUF202 family)
LNPFHEIERQHRRRLRWITIKYWFMIGVVLFILAAPILIAFVVQFARNR